MVDERVVLLRIEHLEQGRGRIPTEVRGHLVDLIQEEDRVDGPRLLHHLDDLSGERSDVSPAVAADFRLVADAAE